jgi:hypothetical protein
MTQREKEIFVSAYIDGNNLGASGLCNALERRETLRDDSCMAWHPVYTHGDAKAIGSFNYVAPYVSVIDDFYKHSECHAMPYVFIMEHLNDAEFKSGEALYKFVRSGQAAWGSFSGFDGIEHCYGADRS